MLLPSSIVAFYFVFELLNVVFPEHVCLFFLFSIIIFHYLCIHLFINITFLKSACRFAIIELIWRVRFFTIFNKSDDNGIGHLIPTNVRCPVDQRSTRMAIQPSWL